jgi:hypothetical protein
MLLEQILITTQTSLFFKRTAKISKKVKDSELLSLPNRNFILFIKIFLYSEIYGWTYGVVNDSDHPIVATLDLTGSNNLMFSTKHGVAKKTLQPRECHFMLHAQAGIGEFSKKVTSTVQHLPKKK